jgi:hypothetical protein
MSLIPRRTDREAVYRLLLVTLHIYLALGVIFAVVHVAAPFLGGKLLANAAIKYASWIVTAGLAIRSVKRRQKRLQLQWHEYLLMGLSSVASLMLSIPHPINIVVSVMAVVIFFLAYKRRPGRP